VHRDRDVVLGALGGGRQAKVAAGLSGYFVSVATEERSKLRPREVSR
jgi:hypothetical protein